MTTGRMTRLVLPPRRLFDDTAPLLVISRFGLQLQTKIVARERFPTRRVIAEFLPPRRIARDVLTVQCVVDGVRFELMREGQSLTPVVTHMEKTLGQSVEAMKRLPNVALGMLVFDHRARCGAPEAVAAVGLIDWLSPRANERKLGETNIAVHEADLAMDNAFSAVSRWLEDGHG
jgi:hypothetical protein